MMNCAPDAAILKQFIESGQIYEFLVGLNMEFDAVKVQILEKLDLLNLNETIDHLDRRGLEKSDARNTWRGSICSCF